MTVLSDSHADKINFIWSVKEVLRDHYRRHQYGEVILPFCLLRRLDCVLEPSKSKVLTAAAQIEGDIDVHFDKLCRVAGQQFYNTSEFSFETLANSPHSVAANLMHFVNGFSPNARDALNRFGLHRHVERMDEAGILYMVVQRFAALDLHPSAVSNLEMGYIYEELIRVNAELSNEEAGEHFTPREVIHLMVNVLFADEPHLLTPRRVTTIYDPACGTGGMLSVADDHLRAMNEDIRVHLYGQEVQPESWAICQADMMIKGQRAGQIAFGDSFTQDGFPDESFEYMLANPPYGKDWKTIEQFVKNEHKTLGFDGRFGAGLPPTSDGQSLFLLQMISKMRSPEKGGSRIAIVMNGSPLFSGDAGGGMSEIRRWIIENDLLEAVIGLPDQLFYNTGINTYIWVVTNRKRPERRGFVQLIDARDQFSKMRRSLGNKRNELGTDHIAQITALYEAFSDNELSKILPNDAFGYRRVTVNRPLRVRFEMSPQAIDALDHGSALAKLEPDVRERLISGFRDAVGRTFRTPQQLETTLRSHYDKAGKVPAPVKKAIVSAFTVRDESADPMLDAKGPVPDPALREEENVPLRESIDKFMEREVLPFVPDAWVDYASIKVGYEIPFARHFYRFVPPRSLEDIDSDIRASEQRVMELLKVVTR